METLLPLHSLRDVVASVADRSFGFTISPKWRCRIAPELGPGADALLTPPRSQSATNKSDDAAGDHDSDTMLRFFDAGIPCKAPQSHSQPVHTTCSDGLLFVSDPRWCNFPTPKIAFKTGWAGPGTEMENEKLHQLVRGFDEVLDASKCVEIDLDNLEKAALNRKQGHDDDDENGGGLERHVRSANLTSDDVLNLQMFHRADASTHPQMPILAEQLIWPRCISKVAATTSAGESAAATDLSVVCDNATRVSKKGAITWWHLDDCGEFVMQTGLRLRQDADKEGSRPKQLPEEQRTPVKLFIYGPPSSYDWFAHDAQSDKCQRIAALDILHAPCEALPPAELLPVMTVAVLRAGGRPLISPPNIPHLVITLTDCVMVEQRRVAYHFLHEVAYFAARMKVWNATPVVYKVLAEDLQNEQKCLAIAETLHKLLLGSSSSAEENGEAESRISKGLQPPPLVRRLAVRSLLALCNGQLFRGGTQRVLDRARAVLLEHAARIGPSAVGAETLALKLYCDVQRAWADVVESKGGKDDRQHGGVFWINAFDIDAQAPAPGAAPAAAAASAAAPSKPKQFCAVLYFGGDSAVKQVLVKPAAAQCSSEQQQQQPAAEGDDKLEDMTPTLPAGAWRLRNGVFPFYGPVRAAQAQAEEDLRRAVARLVAATYTPLPKTSKKANKDELGVRDILDAFVVHDQLLDELF